MVSVPSFVDSIVAALGKYDRGPMSEYLVGAKKKYRVVWSREGVQAIWNTDGDDNYIPGTAHVKIDKNRHQDKVIFGKRTGIDPDTIYFDS